MLQTFRGDIILEIVLFGKEVFSYARLIREALYPESI